MMRSALLRTCLVVLVGTGVAHAQTPAHRAPPAGPSDVRSEAMHARVRGMLDSIVGQPKYRNSRWGILIVDPATGARN